MLKKFLISIGVVLLLSFTNCGGESSKEARELLNKILQFVGIPHSIIVNVCQDSNRDGICGAKELFTKLVIKKGESVEDILHKISLTADGQYFLETYDPTLPILVELQDTAKINYDEGKFTLIFNGFKTKDNDKEIKEISILESMIDANFLRVLDVADIRNLQDKKALDKYYSRLLEDLENNINKLRKHGLISNQAVRESLKYMSRELLNNDIKTQVPIKLNSCNGDDGCIDSILNPLYIDLLITEEEAEAIKVKINTPTTIKGTIKEASTQKPLENVTITLYSNGNILKEIKSDHKGEYIFENIPTNSNYHIQISKIGYLDITYSNIDIFEHEIKYLETILQIEEKYAGVGTISGTITDAINGDGKSGLQINFRKNINTKEGEIVAQVMTQSSGYYILSGLEVGNYTAEIIGDGYQTAYITVIVLGGETTRNQNGTITPLLSENEIRIVLSWGNYPADLDSHLTGPKENSSERFHIYFYNEGSIESSPYVNLDVDDVNQYGPETITINKKISGVYRYSVHNFSGENSRTKNDNYYNGLANSNAKVRVFNDNGLVYEASVPNQKGTIWTVFTIEGHEVLPINKVSFPNYNITYDNNFKIETKTDAELMINLPSKN